MNESILILVLTYSALAILLLALHIYSNIPVWVKAGLIILIGGFFFITYNSLHGMLGWPAKRDLPEEFLLIASRVIEPNKKDKAKGEIYIWAAAINNSQIDIEPRAYRIDYTPELHEDMDNANWRMRRGRIQMGRIEKIEAPNKVSEKQRTSEVIERITIFDLPDPQLPEK